MRGTIVVVDMDEVFVSKRSSVHQISWAAAGNDSHFKKGVATGQGIACKLAIKVLLLMEELDIQFLEHREHGLLLEVRDDLEKRWGLDMHAREACHRRRPILLTISIFSSLGLSCCRTIAYTSSFVRPRRNSSCYGQKTNLAKSETPVFEIGIECNGTLI